MHSVDKPRYTPSITVPHPRKLTSGQSSVGILEALDAPSIAARYAQAKEAGPQAADKFRIATALFVAGLTHKALWFSLEHDADSAQQSSSVTDSYSPSQLVGPSQITDCYGHSIVASECLAAAGIEHWLGYANNHSFLLVPSGQTTTQSAWLINPSSPRVSQDLTGAVSRGNFSKVGDQITEHGRGAVAIDSGKLASTLKTDIEALDQEHGWFLKRTASQTLNPVRHQSDAAFLRRQRVETTLITSIFPATAGRIILENFAGYQSAATRGQWRQALLALEAMPGLYPEIDAHGEHCYIRDTVRGLAQTNDITAAKRAISTYFSSFTITKDARIAVLEGDCWRDIASHTAGGVKKEMLGEAYRCYVTASEHTIYSSLPKGKLRKLARSGF